MNLKNRMIMEEYFNSKESFTELGHVVSTLIKEKIAENNIQVLAVEHRVKEENSLAGKLELKGDKYTSLADITDILGARVICYFSDDVDNIANIIENLFDIDWENSVDKRAQLNPDAFGYLSLHYICSIPNDGRFPENICNKKFEIQIRSTLQHVWADINHDLGYKTEFGIPKKITRAFSRVAGLLEVADLQFIEIRDSVNRYEREIKEKIANNQADDILIDLVSLREYIFHNKKMAEFLQNIAGICGAEIKQIDPENYIEQLQYLNKTTIGHLQQMLEDNKDVALKLAEKSLENTELDILSSNVGMRFLCRAELLLKKYKKNQIVEFLNLSINNEQRAMRQAERLLKVYNELKEANNE